MAKVSRQIEGVIEGHSTLAHDEPNPADLILGIDAGGTKTAAWIARLQGRDVTVIGKGEAASGNPLSAGIDLATRSIAEAADRARADAGIRKSPVSRAVLSVAGSADRKVSQLLIQWVREAHLAERFAICSDFFPILAAGIESAVGVVLIAGTGSVAFARVANGRTARFGGWGFMVGDDGSGYAIGRDAIRCALNELECQPEEGVATPYSSLTSQVAERLRARSVADVTTAIYSADDSRAVVASLATCVIDEAEAGDRRACMILDNAARELAQLVERAGRFLQAPQPISIAMAGGVLIGSPYLRTALLNELARQELAVVPAMVRDPVHGCILLASPECTDLGLEWHERGSAG